MSSNTSKDLIDLIDSRVSTNRYQRVAVVESVSEDGKSAVVSFPGTDMTVETYIKTPEKLEVGDSVNVGSTDGSLMNAFVQTKFGESKWLSVGSGIDVDPGVIDNDNLADGSVTEGKIADFSVTNAKIGYAEIDTANIRKAAITTALIENATITSAKIQDAAITNAKIENLAVDNAKIAIAAIDTANIRKAAITTVCIGDAAIKTTQIADGSVTDAKIVGLTADKITAGTIDAGAITVVNLNAANITVGKINGVQIEDGAIGIAKLDAIVNDKIATAQATADGKNTIFYHGVEPVADNVKKDDTWFDIDDGYKMYTYDGTAWIAAPFGTDAIDDSAVTGTKLANGTITGVKMVNGAITAREIATGAVIADKIAANAVTANAIEAKSITALHIDTNTITADKLLLGDNTNFSTVWLSQYTTTDWADWTGMAFPTAVKDVDDYVHPELGTSTDFLFSMPCDATALTTVLTENSFGFKFSTKNSATTNKTALLSVYFFDSDKKYLNKTTLETIVVNGITDDEIDNEIQDWEFTKTIARNSSAKYFCFGVNVAAGFTVMFKDIQVRRSSGSTFINDGSITTTKIVTDAITSDKIAAKSIIANKIASNTITSEEIAAGAITADEIAANAVTAMKIKAGEVTTDHIAPNFGETLDITSNSAVTGLDGRLTSAELKIAPNAIVATVTSSSDYTNDLADKASLADLNSLDSRVDSAELKITPSAITSTVRSSSEYTNDLGSKLPASSYTGNEIVSRINQTSTTIDIDASKVNITGFVTFANLSNSGQTTINGGNITTGTISASRINFTGALNGYTSNTSGGFKVSANGIMTCDTIYFDKNWGNRYITYGGDGAGALDLYNQSGSIRLLPLGYNTEIQNLYAKNQPINIPMTNSGAQKINAINYQTGTAGEHSIGTYLEVATANYGAFGLNWWASDISLKKNIVDYSGTSALDKINRIKHREFDWKSNDIHVSIGYVSQELMTIDNSFAFEVKQDGQQSTYQPNETVIIPTITKAVQELSAENEELKTKVNNLENQINELIEIINAHLVA